MRTFRLLIVALALFGWLGSRAAAPASSVSEALRAWTKAVGGQKVVGRARSAALGADATTDGIAGQVEVALAGEDWRRMTTQGARASESVVAAGVAWTKDWNGNVRELKARDRMDQLTQAGIERLLFGDGLVRAAAFGDAALTAEGLLRFTPKDGAPFDVALDPSTHLPAKVTRKYHDDVITLTPTDWKTVEGRKVPFSVSETAGDGEDEEKLIVRDWTPRDGSAAVPFRRPADGAKDYRFDEGTAATGIPFNFENDHIMISAAVNGRPGLWFMLDTGAEATIVNKPRMDELGLVPFGSSSISGGGNSTDFAYAAVAKLRVGSVELLDQRDGVIDLSGLERIYGMPMGGILGYDFLSRFVVRVNYDAKTLDLLEPAGYVYGGAGVRLPFVIEKGVPHVSSTITVPAVPPIDADFIVDCGAADTVNLTSPFVKEHQLVERTRKAPPGGPNTMAGSEKEFFAQTSVRGKLGGISLATFTLRDIPSNLMVGTTGAYASSAFSGTVGEGVLHRFNTVYDYSRGVMILEPNAEYEKPFPPRRTFGATFLSDGADYTRFKVTGIRKGSPAEAAGLKKDDWITAVDGKPNTELCLADLRALLSADGAHRKVQVKRGDETVTLEFDVTLVSIDES